VKPVRRRSHRKTRRAWLGSVAALGALAIAAACGSSSGGGTFAPPGGDGGPTSDGSSSSSSSGGDAPSLPTTRDDFHAPILDTGAPANAPQLFGAPDTGTGGPCLYEPEIGSLFPNNWLRLRYRFTTAHQENLFEIKLVVPNEVDPLVIYTTQSGYTMTQAVWSIVTTVGSGAPIHVTVRSAVVTSGQLTGGPWMGSEGDVQVAPVAASGSVVYWTTSNGTVLKGFHIGDESVQSVITTAQASTACVACHTSTPDGLFVGLTGSTDPGNGGAAASIDLRSVNGQATRPPFLTPNGLSLLQRTDQHAAAFSPAHWQAGDHVALSMYNVNGNTEIAWTDLESTSPAQGTGWGVLARNGDARMAASATMSHDGKTVVYTSATSVDSGTNTPDGLVYTVPYANRAGGAASPLKGASDASFVQYYPVYSADDRFVAFNRVPSGNKSYNDPLAELFIVPAAGQAQPVRLAANDPPVCTGLKSPGITNSWPKWSPQALSSSGSTYYWLVFASTRDAPGQGASPGPQLYVAPFMVDGAGKVTSYSALYCRNQPETEHNHTPAWDVFQLPVQ
jgi:hypothetical protein